MSVLYVNLCINKYVMAAHCAHLQDAQGEALRKANEHRRVGRLNGSFGLCQPTVCSGLAVKPWGRVPPKYWAVYGPSLTKGVCVNACVQ